MNAEVVGFVLIAGVLAMTFLFTRPSSSVNGLDPVHQNLPRFHGLRGEGDGDGTLETVVGAPLQDADLAGDGRDIVTHLQIGQIETR